MAKNKATKASGNGKLGRRAAATKVVVDFQGKSTLSELAAQADALVVAAGGKSNVRATQWYVRRALETAASFGMVQLHRPVDIVVVKPEA